MKALVLGAGGYIGLHMVHALRARGHEVVAYHGRHGPLEGRLDIGDAQALSAVDWAVDRVFVLAGATGTMASFADAEGYVRSNEIGLLNVLHAVRQSAYRPRVVFPSSRLVYKGSPLPLPETAEQEAKTVYAANKIACEWHLRSHAAAFDLPYSIFRVGVPYGNSQSEQYSVGTLGHFIRQASGQGSIRLYGDGSLRRTFSHVDDICSTLIDGATRADFENETFNMPGEDLSLLDVAQIIAGRLGASIAFAPWPPLDERIESGSTVFDCAKLLRLLPGAAPRRMAQWASVIDPAGAAGHATNRAT
jgi:UDP-glucose 4-epimerase